MKFPTSFPKISQTLKRFTNNFNNCLPPFLRTRQKPSNLTAEIDPLISDQKIRDSSRPDQLTNSAGDFLVKPVIPISNTDNPTHHITLSDHKLNPNDALDGFANIHMDPNNRPESGAGVFAMKKSSEMQPALFSEINPLQQRSQRPLQKS